MDILVRHGGTAILSETPEIHGVEYMLTRRAVSAEVGQKLLDRLAWWEQYTAGHNAQFNGVVGHGNQQGGLANIFEKSLGSAMKGGTTPLQATKLYEAIRGNGGTSRLVMLPHEPHWYTAMESNEQLAYEMVSWFDKYVKEAAPRAKPVKAKK